MNRKTDVREWLKYAEADRRSAYNAMRADDYRDVALHCQQIVEKLLKAVIVQQTHQRPPPICITFGDCGSIFLASRVRRTSRRRWLLSTRTIF
jgi:hypothetical protein